MGLYHTFAALLDLVKRPLRPNYACNTGKVWDRPSPSSTRSTEPRTASCGGAADAFVRRASASAHAHTRARGQKRSGVTDGNSSIPGRKNRRQQNKGNNRSNWHERASDGRRFGEGVPGCLFSIRSNQGRRAGRGNGVTGNAPLGDFAGGLGAGRVGWIADLDVQTWSTRLRDNGQ